jgi:hypothetical protein
MQAMHAKAEQILGSLNLLSAGIRPDGGSIRGGGSLENIVRKSRWADMRQGSASRRRHVARALLLC